MSVSKYVHMGPTADSTPFDNENDPNFCTEADTVQEALDDAGKRAYAELISTTYNEFGLQGYKIKAEFCGAEYTIDLGPQLIFDECGTPIKVLCEKPNPCLSNTCCPGTNCCC